MDEKYASDRIIVKINEQINLLLTHENEYSDRWLANSKKLLLHKIHPEILAITLLSQEFNDLYFKCRNTEWKLVMKDDILNYLLREQFSIVYIPWLASNDSLKLTSKSGQSSITALINQLIENENKIRKGDSKKIETQIVKLINSASIEDLINEYDVTKKGMFHLVSRLNDTSILMLLLKKLSGNEDSLRKAINMRDIYLRTPLHLSCQFGNLDSFLILLKYNANPILQDSVGRTVAHYSCTNNNPLILDQIIKKYPASFRVNDYYNRTPLHYLVFNQSKLKGDLSKLLFKSIQFDSLLEVNTLDENGFTALHYASKEGEDWILSDLINHNSDILLENIDQKTAIQIAKDDRIKEMILVAFSNKSLKPIQPAANINQSDNNKLKEKAKDEVMRELLDQKIKEEEEMRKYYQEIIYGINGLANLQKDCENTKFDKDLYLAFVEERKSKVSTMLDIMQTSSMLDLKSVSNPHFITGSWMNDIETPEDLIKYLSEYSPSEAVMLLYNILNPISFSKYEQTLNNLQSLMKENP